MGELKSSKPLQRLLTEPQLANSIRSHTVKPPSADRLTECDILLAAGGGYTARVSASIFPPEWLPAPEPEYIVRWRNLAAQRRGTRVFVDIRGRPFLVTVRKTKGFIDLSRAARARRSLLLLLGLLDVLGAPSESLIESQRRSLALQRLDQGLGDLLRVVRSGRESRGRGRGTRGPSAPLRGEQAAVARSSSKREG